MGLDHLQAFIHHARAIDGDLAAHAPGRVIQGFLESHIANLLGAPSSERSAACREDDRVQMLRLVALEALEDRAMLAINWSHRDSSLLDKWHHQMARRNQNLFAGKGDLLARINRGESRLEADDSRHRDHHEICALQRGEIDDRIHASGNPCRLGRLFVHQGYVGHTKFARLILQFCGRSVCGQAHNLELIGELADDIKRLPPDAAGASQDHDPLHFRSNLPALPPGNLDLMRPLPPQIVCLRLPGDPDLSLGSDAPEWRDAPWFTEFVDILGSEHGRGPSELRARLGWTERGLFLNAEIPQNHLWVTQHEHDSNLFVDDVFELFLDPHGDGHHYFEWEINPLGVTLDLAMDRPYVCGGTRNDAWEIPGLETHLVTHGPVNDPSSECRGWDLNAFFPWESFGPPGGDGRAPERGDIWRCNLMKVAYPVEVRDGQYRHVEGATERYWVAAPTGIVDIHRPHSWAFLVFADCSEPCLPDLGWADRELLAEISGLNGRKRSEGLLNFDQIELPERVTRVRDGLLCGRTLLTAEGQFVSAESGAMN